MYLNSTAFDIGAGNKKFQKLDAKIQQVMRYLDGLD